VSVVDVEREILHYVRKLAGGLGVPSKRGRTGAELLYLVRQAHPGVGAALDAYLASCRDWHRCRDAIERSGIIACMTDQARAELVLRGLERHERRQVLQQCLDRQREHARLRQCGLAGEGQKPECSDGWVNQ